MYTEKKRLKDVPNWRYLWVRFWKAFLQLSDQATKTKLTPHYLHCLLWNLLRLNFWTIPSHHPNPHIINYSFLWILSFNWDFLFRISMDVDLMKIDWWLCSCQLHGIRECTMFGNHASIAALWQVWDLLLLSSKFYNQVLKLRSSTQPYSWNSLLHLLQKVGQKMWSRNSHFSRRSLEIF